MGQEKRQKPLEERGVDFLYAAQIFEGETVMIVDDRRNYGEVRYIAVGSVAGELFSVV